MRSLCLGMALMMSVSWTAFAATDGATGPGQAAGGTVSGAVPSGATVTLQNAAQPTVAAQGAVLYDATHNQFLFSKNADTQYYPASITKLMTALLVAENCNLSDTVTFSQTAVSNLESGAVTLQVKAGDTFTVKDCLYGLLLKSANEVANGLAEHVSGSVSAFADKMNEKAASLGCTHTHFANPNGLNNANHFTTAHDMALIANAAFNNATVRQVASTLHYDFPATASVPTVRTLTMGHKMLNPANSQYYEGIIGGKTGYTMLAGNTLVTCAEKNGMKLIAVILNGHQTHYTDTKALLDFGFANFQSVNIADADSTYSSVSNDMTIAGLPAADLSVLHMQKDCYVTLPKTADISDAQSAISYELPESAPSEAVARIFYQYNDRQIGVSYLLHKVADEETAAAAARSGAALNESGADASVQGGSTDYEADVSQAGIEEESSFSQDPLALAETDPLASSGSEEKKPVSGARRPGIHLNIPPAFWIIVGAAAVAAIIGSGLLTAKYRIEKREEEERSERYERRRQRLQDIGMTTSEFDMMLQQKRSDSALKQTNKRKRPKRHKSFLDEKNFRDHE